MPDVDLLPRALRLANEMKHEIALPYPAVLEAVDALAAQDVLLLGWEPFAPNGPSAYSAPAFGGLMGIEVPESGDEWDDAVQESAELHRSTITRQAETVDEALVFCLVPLTRGRAPLAWDAQPATASSTASGMSKFA